MSLINPFGMPGMGDPTLTNENQFLWGSDELRRTQPIILDASTVDAGATPTTSVRRGLVLGRITATNTWKQYDPTATDGSQVAGGILLYSRNMLDFQSGVTQAVQAELVIAGCLRVNNLYGFDENARRHLGTRFLFDDLPLFAGVGGSYPVVQPKTANYSVLPADNNTLFTTLGAAGAVMFTLPTPARGLRFKFFNAVDQNLTVAAAGAGQLITFNNTAASSVAISTAGQKVGGGFEAIGSSDGSKFLISPIVNSGQTLTVA